VESVRLFLREKEREERRERTINIFTKFFFIFIFRRRLSHENFARGGHASAAHISNPGELKKHRNHACKQIRDLKKDNIRHFALCLVLVLFNYSDLTPFLHSATTSIVLVLNY
jgi:hypothetical protein